MITPLTRHMLKNLTDNDIHVRIIMFENRIKRYQRKIDTQFGVNSEMGRYFMRKTEEALMSIREHEMMLHERHKRLKKG